MKNEKLKMKNAKWGYDWKENMTTEEIIERPCEILHGGLSCQERTFASWDSTELFFRGWLPAGPVRKAVVLFHRGHEHSGRFGEFVEELALEDVAVFAWDARGHGRSPGERGYAENFGCVVRDIDCFVRFVCREYDIPMEN